MKPQSVTAAIRDLELGKVVYLQQIGTAVYYFKTVVRVGDDLVEKPQFSIPGRMVVREFDEVVTVIALPIEVGVIQLQRLAQDRPDLVGQNAPQQPQRLNRRDKEERWLYPSDIALGTIISTLTNGMAVYRGLLPDDAGVMLPTAYTYNGMVITLPAKKRVFTHTFPVQNAWHYVSHP